LVDFLLVLDGNDGKRSRPVLGPAIPDLKRSHFYVKHGFPSKNVTPRDSRRRCCRVHHTCVKYFVTNHYHRLVFGPLVGWQRSFSQTKSRSVQRQLCSKTHRSESLLVLLFPGPVAQLLHEGPMCDLCVDRRDPSHATQHAWRCFTVWSLRYLSMYVFIDGTPSQSPRTTRAIPTSGCVQSFGKPRKLTW
jgi:hypothetical protein